MSTHTSELVNDGFVFCFVLFCFAGETTLTLSFFLRGTVALFMFHCSLYIRSICDRCFQDNKVLQTPCCILIPLSAFSVFKLLSQLSLSRCTLLLYKDCIDIHLYLMKKPSNNNATVQDYQPSISTATRRSGLRGNGVNTFVQHPLCLLWTYNWIFDCDNANPLC